MFSDLQSAEQDTPPEPMPHPADILTDAAM